RVRCENREFQPGDRTDGGIRRHIGRRPGQCLHTQIPEAAVQSTKRWRALQTTAAACWSPLCPKAGQGFRWYRYIGRRRAKRHYLTNGRLADCLSTAFPRRCWERIAISDRCLKKHRQLSNSRIRRLLVYRQEKTQRSREFLGRSP